VTSIAAAALALGTTAALADDDNDGKRSDFALFDGTNPDNVNNQGGRTGVVCGVSNRKQTALVPRSFTYHVAVTNDGSGGLECKVIYTDGDFIRVKIPLGQSLSLSQAAGSNSFDAAVRLDCDRNVSGAMSAQGPHRVFCVSCDANDAFCDGIIATP
jgi:hypothetical protein